MAWLGKHTRAHTHTPKGSMWKVNINKHGTWMNSGLKLPALALLFFSVSLFLKKNSFFFKQFCLFIFDCPGSSLLHVGFPYCYLWCAGSPLQRLLLFRSTGSGGVGFEWHTGLVALRRVGFCRTRDQTHAVCTGRQILKPLDHQGSPRPSLKKCEWSPTRLRGVKSRAQMCFARLVEFFYKFFFHICFATQHDN